MTPAIGEVRSRACLGWAFANGPVIAVGCERMLLSADDMA